eukprot:1105754-Pyramimonas_sp.AAC.1
MAPMGRGASTAGRTRILSRSLAPRFCPRCSAHSAPLSSSSWRRAGTSRPRGLSLEAHRVWVVPLP